MTVCPPFQSGKGQAIFNSFATWPMETTVYVVLTFDDLPRLTYEFYSVYSTREDAEDLAKALRNLGLYADAIVTESVLH